MWFWSEMGNTFSETVESILIPEMSVHSKKQKTDSPMLSKRLSLDLYERDDYGWFEDTEPPILSEDSQRPLHRALSNPPPVTEAPDYILESSLETQQLWYNTAGQRPQQPTKEREYFENLWKQNFQSSSVSYGSSNMEQIHQDSIPNNEFNGTIVMKEKSMFSNSVSKSFNDEHIQSLTIQVPQYRIFETKGKVQYAEFLVLVSIGSHSTVRFGVWKRHTDFEKLANTLAADERSTALFKNTLLSWQCMMQRKKWYKCLDQSYLSIKCFLLERVMHDMLFESQTPQPMMKFLGFVNGDVVEAIANSP